VIRQSHESTDALIRGELRSFVKSEHESAPEAVFVEEFALYGGAIRADFVSLNGVSHGYEIKSDRDTLFRLPRQVSAYNAVFERATLISAERHISSARSIIPKWWGIIRVTWRESLTLTLERIRESRSNPSPDGEAIASLLWRPEALQLLTSLGLDGGVRSKSMHCLIERLALSVDRRKLSNCVREIIRARGDWRSAARLRQCDDTFQPLSNRWHFPRNPYERRSR
jgi:hypothetical protein